MERRSKVLLRILAVIILGLLAFQTPLLTRLRGKIWDAWVGVIAYLNKIGPGATDNDIMSQLQTLRAETIRLNAELRRYQRLERQLGVPAFRTFRSVPALVGTQPIDMFRAQYFLNRGVEDGVVLGAPVITEGSILVGFITELAPRSSVMQLLFHPATNVPVEVAPPEDTSKVRRGLLQGQSYTSLALTTVPRDLTLTPGMTIVTTAYHDSVPTGLMVGLVGAIQSSEADAYQRANVEVPYDPDSLEAVHILVPGKEKL